MIITQRHYIGIVAALLLLLALPTLAQEAPLELSKFRMLLYSGQYMEGSHGLLTDTEFTGTNKNGDVVMPTTAALTGVGALVGAMIGSNTREWNNLQLTPAVGISPDRTSFGYAVTISF